MGEKIEYTPILIAKLENGITKGYNFISKDGKFLSEKWFEYASDFKDGFSKVKIDGYWNFIDVEGNSLVEDKLNHVENFVDDIAIVEFSEGGCNFLKKDGKYISRRTFDEAFCFDENGLAIVKIGNKFNLLKKNNRLLSIVGFDRIDDFFEDIYVICNKVGGDMKYNIINTKGELLCPSWREFIGYFNEYGLAEVRENGKCNYINTKGDIICDMWFYSVYRFDNGLAQVELEDETYNYIDSKGNLQLKEWKRLDDGLRPLG